MPHEDVVSGRYSKVSLQDVHRIAPGHGRTKSSAKQVRKPRKTKKFTPPAPYTGPRHIDGRLLHCYYCDVSKTYKSRLVDHMAFHFPPEHDCPECGKAFHTAYTLKKHMMVHSENLYKCHLCEFTTKYSGSIRKHIAWHRKKAMSSEADTKPNIMQIVPIEAVPRECLNERNQVALDGHLSVTNKTKWEMKAKACTKLPPPYTGPRQPDDGYFHCYYCPKAFNTRKKLESHMFGHLPPQYFCKLCGFGFSKSTYYNRHKKLAHSSKKSFKCRLCDFRAKWDSTLFAHVRKVHDETSEIASKRKPSFVSCYHCGWTTNYKSRLIPHVQRHLQRESGCKVRQLPKVSMYQHEVVNSELPGTERESAQPSKGQLPLDCSFCDYRAKSRPTLRKHISMKHSGNRECLKCQLCSFQTKYSHSLRMHMMRHTNHRAHACPHCDYRAISKAKLKNHIERHSGKNLHECHLCKFRCATTSSLNSHLMCHSDLTNFTCPLCPFSTFQISSFAVHLKKHADSTDMTYIDAETALITEDVDKKPYLCQLCGHPAETVIRLYEHIRSHGRERHFKCPHCPYATFNHSILNEHVNARHTKEVLFKCEYCDFKTPYKNSLKGHTNSVHTRSQWFNCRFCDYKGLLKRTVANHERTHTGDKRYECDLCGYRSITSGRLKEHKLTHTVDRPFACELCEFRARAKKHIQRHMQGVHSSERPFKCSFCSESFKTKQTAKLHELCHTGKRVYRCPKCTYNTVLKRYLQNHMVEMHPVNQKRKKLRVTYPSGRKILWYRCNECAFAVTCKPSLVRHMKLRHPKNS